MLTFHPSEKHFIDPDGVADVKQLLFQCFYDLMSKSRAELNAAAGGAYDSKRLSIQF